MKKSCVSLFILIGGAFILLPEKGAQIDAQEITVPGASSALVMIDARVTDDSGNHVPGLKQEDFEIYQDGRPQAISHFHAIGREEADAESRQIIFIIDDLGLSKVKLNQVRTALKYFAEKVMRPTDSVALAHTAGGGVVLQPFTSNSARLQASVDGWQWSAGAARPFQSMALASQASSSAFVRSCSGST
jgi:VWFA-related protein